MTRTHRSVHRLLWPALTVAVAAAFFFALYLRPPPPVPEPESPPAEQRS